MPQQNDHHVFLGNLLAEARRNKGFKTVKEIYQSHKPTVDYQTWSNAESGRRIPHPNSLLEMAKILDIDKEDLLIAYTKDKFRDEESHNILNTFPINKFVDLGAMLEAADHASRHDYVLSSKQIDAMRKDIRLRLFLMYTYDDDFKTNFDRLATFFSYDKSEVEKVTKKLEELGLVEIIGEEVKRVHKYTSLPPVEEAFNLRRDILFKTLELSLTPESHIENVFVTLSESSYKKIMELIYFLRANLIRLEKESKPEQKSRFQIAIVANRIDEGKAHGHIT